MELRRLMHFFFKRSPSHIVLHGKALVESIGLKNLDFYLKELKTRYVVEETLNDALFQNLTTMFRNLDIKPRTARKMELMRLALEPNNDDLDLHVLDRVSSRNDIYLDVLMNCVRKLPEYNSDEPIGEQDLIMNYIDPVINPIFHQPDNGRTLHWLNRTTEDTETLRPDGCIYLTRQQNVRYAIGYCEVKTRDAENDVDSTHVDLFWLANFCKNSIDKSHVSAMVEI